MSGMDRTNVRVLFEITKAGALSSQEESQVRQLKLQLAGLQQKGLAHSTELVYNGLDLQQVVAFEKIAVVAMDQLQKLGEADLAAKRAGSGTG